MFIAVRHSRDATAIAVATRVSTLLGGATLSPADSVDDGESNCRVHVDGRMVASVLWFRNQDRTQAWIEAMADRLAKTVTDQGFGGNAVCSIEALHSIHGVDHYDASAQKRALAAARKADQEARKSEGFDPSTLGDSIPTIDSDLQIETDPREGSLK